MNQCSKCISAIIILIYSYIIIAFYLLFQSNWTEGKLYCPKCSSRIGAFNITRGVTCSCFAYIIPAVWIQKCKVDQVTIADSKPNIRLPPRRPTEPGSYHGKNNHHDATQTSQTSSQTGQTSCSHDINSMQNSQTGKQTGKMTNDCHASQTGQTGYTCDAQMSRAGFSTQIPKSSNASEVFFSDSGHFESCTCSYTGQTSLKQATCDSEFYLREHETSMQNDSQALQLTGFEQEPAGLSGLQSEALEALQIWPGVIRSYKAFNVNQSQNIHPYPYLLTNQSFRRTQSSNQDYELCSESSSIVYRRSKRTQHIESDGIYCEDCSGSLVESVGGEKSQQQEKEVSVTQKSRICMYMHVYLVKYCTLSKYANFIR